VPQGPIPLCGLREYCDAANLARNPNNAIRNQPDGFSVLAGMEARSRLRLNLVRLALG